MPIDDHGFVTGGKAGSVAAAKIAELFPDITFVTTSRRSLQEPTHAKTMADEMVRFGANEQQIILEENSWDTFSEMAEAIELARENGWSRIAFITNDYHIPRAKMFFARMLELARDNEQLIEKIKDFNNSAQVSFISAETVLENISGHYKHLISQARITEAYQQRLDAEKRGIEALQSGNYRVGKDPLAEPAATPSPDSKQT